MLASQAPARLFGECLRKRRIEAAWARGRGDPGGARADVYARWAGLGVRDSQSLTRRSNHEPVRVALAPSAQLPADISSR
jgi:hypothetical protein